MAAFLSLVAASSFSARGPRLPDLFGADYTRRHPAELFGPQERTIGRTFAAHLALVSRQGRIGLASFIAWNTGDLPTRVLSLPLGDGLVLSAFEPGGAGRPSRFDPANAGLQD